MGRTNRITELFQKKKQQILSVFFTAGYPQLSSTVPLCEALASSGADMIEIGFPFSDPLADGETIQKSSEEALKNGMTLELLFQQLSEVRAKVQVPLLLMGYLNPVLQYGMVRFCEDCARCGIDGLILPDLPLAEYQSLYRDLFEKNGLKNIFLVTPQTLPERIRLIDATSDAFIYAVSSPSITGSSLSIGSEQEKYMQRLTQMELRNPLLLGFGIGDSQAFNRACAMVPGAIVGSALIRALASASDPVVAARQFVASIR